MLASVAPMVISWAQNAELLQLLILKDLRVRYKSSFLGYLWAIANPLAFTLVYYIAFQVIMRVQVEHFEVYLVTGLFPWTWLAGSLVQSARAYRANASLVRKVQVRRAILPLSSAMHEMVHFAFAMPIVLGAVVVATGAIHISWVAWIPVMAGLQLAMVYPLGVALAALNVIVRDVEYVIGIVLQMLFFLTPIVYPRSAVPEAYRPIFDLNPFSVLIESWRSVFYDGRLALASVGQCLAFAAAAGLLARVIHRRIEPRVGELL